MTDYKDGDFEKTVKGAREKLAKMKNIMSNPEIKKAAPDTQPVKVGSTLGASGSGGGGGGSSGSYSSGIPMKFPYTFTAKAIQFPWKFYMCNNWIWGYYFIGVLVCVPIFKKISNVVNSEGNVKKWEEMKKAEAAGHH